MIRDNSSAQSSGSVPADTCTTLRPAGTPAPAGGRDLRVDFFRGLALLSILTTHILEVSGTSTFIPRYLYLATPAKWSISTPTDLFVFLSGYVYGLVYMRVLERRGVLPTFRKSARRAWQLYVANLATLLIALGLISLARTQWDLDVHEVNRLLDLPPSAPTVEVVWQVMSFRAFPYGFDILALYMCLLLVGPVFLVLMRKKKGAALAVSLVVYGAAQLGLALPHSVTGVWFNPFAWQLIFVLGIYLSSKRPVLHAPPAVVAAALCVLLALAVAMVRFHLSYPYSGKVNLEPVRVLHFMTVVYVTATLTSGHGELWRRAGVMPVVVTGQHGLPVFCLGLVLTFGGCAVMHAARHEWPFVLGLLVTGCLALIGFAHVVQWITRGRYRERLDRPTAITAMAPEQASDPGRAPREVRERMES